MEKKVRFSRAATLPVVVFIVVLVFVVFLFGVIGQKKEDKAREQAAALKTKRPPVNVVAMTVQEAPIRDALRLPGVLEPWTDLTLLSKIHGEIIDVPVREGDRVQKGAVLARIDPADYRIALDAARASLVQAETDRNRTRTLFQKGLAPRAKLDGMQTRVKTARAAVEDAELKLSRCTITAPMTGVIERLDAKPGLLLNIADPVGRLLAVDRIKAVVGIPESDVDAVKKINTVSMTVTGLNDRHVVGTKHFLSFAPTNAARLYRLELEIPNPQRTLRPGMFVRAHIVKKTVSNAVSIPLYAVVKRGSEQFVYVVQDNKAVKRPVVLGILEKWQVQVKSGLVTGEQVIIEGHRSVEDGRRVHVSRVLTGPGEAMP